MRPRAVLHCSYAQTQAFRWAHTTMSQVLQTSRLVTVTVRATQHMTGGLHTFSVLSELPLTTSLLSEDQLTW